MRTTTPHTPEDETTGLRTLIATKKRVAATVGASAVAVALVLGACGSDTPETTGSGEATESAEESGNEATEGSGEGSGASGEGSEGSGSGEAVEAGHGEGGGNGEAAEGGVVNLLTPDQTYDEPDPAPD